MGFKLRPGTSVFGNVTFTPGTNENYVAPPEPPTPLPINPLFVFSQFDDTPENGPIDSGSVYIYNLDNLAEEPIVKLSPAEGSSAYGSSAYRSSNYFFVGSRAVDSETINNHGVVYVYDVNDVNQLVTTLSPTNPTESLEFGKSVSGDEEILAVGSEGVLYVYDMNNLSDNPIELLAPETGNTFLFGEHCLVLPNHIVTTQRAYSHDSDTLTYSGVFWVYDRNDLSASPTRVGSPTQIAKYGQFASSIKMSEDGSKFIVGAGIGNIYVYDSNSPFYPISQFVLSDELKNINQNDARYSSLNNALSDTHFVATYSNYYGQDNNGEYLTIGAVYIWPQDNPSATPITFTGFDVGITRSSLGTPAWTPSFGDEVELVGDKLIISSVEGTPERPDRPGTVRVYDINDLSSPLATLRQSDSEYVSHDLFGRGLYAPGSSVG